MNSDYKSAIVQTLNNLLKADKPEKANTVDMGAFVASLKKELIGLKIPVYDVRVSTYRHNVIVVELPFNNSCEIEISDIEFGKQEKQAILYVDKKPVRRIKLEELNPKYMNSIAMALVDYFKRFLLLKNKFDS